MPKPTADETREHFISRCIPKVIEDGTTEDSDQAVALCNSIWDEAKDKKSVDTDGDMEISTSNSVDGTVVHTDGTSSVTYKKDDANSEAPDNAEDTKAVVTSGRSLNELVEDVYNAWDMQMPGGFVSEVYEKYAIVYRDRKLWKVPYSRNKDEIEFAEMTEWAEVKPTRGFVEKHAHQFSAVKSADGYIEGYGVLWGDENRKDLHEEYFTPNTQEMKSLFEQMGALPWLFHHAADGTLKSTVVAKVVEMDEDDVGLWYRAKITEHEAYRKYVEPLIKERKIFSSSGVLPAAKRVKKSGEIVRWPIVEMTGTHVPAEHRMLNVPISTVNKYFKSIGLPGLDDDKDEGSGSEKDFLRQQIEQQRLTISILEKEN